jgi:hypothetical protein
MLCAPNQPMHHTSIAGKIIGEKRFEQQYALSQATLDIANFFERA